ncbi:MAG TPA: apolipoprotein N-acyltransferase [Burkholderiales bacterium]|nr:apolipoprotein N-acyltransferase [Burkholderiales bacterium]
MHLLYSFLAGAATTLAFAPFGLHPLALLTSAVLVRLWMHAPPQRCALLGFAFAAGLFGAGVSWVYVSLHQFGGMAAPLAAFATVVFCALLALFPAAAGWLQARVPATDPARACLLIPAAWVLSEWMLSWIFTGFPWLALGYSAAGWPLQGYAPLGGVYAVSFLIVSVGGMLWLLFGHKPRFLVVLVLVLGTGEALRHVAWTLPAGAPVPTALLQGNIAQEVKFVPERAPRILETYARLAEGTQARLVIFPETALPAFLDRIDPAYLARLDAVGKRNEGDLLVGVPYRAGRDVYYNSAFSLGVSPRQIYHKVHLVPFGEFVPLGFRWTLDVLSIPLSDFSRGSPAQPPLDVGSQRVAVNICYEDVFGAEIMRLLPEATLLVNMSNVAWFGDSLAPAQHLQIARIRAIESGRMYLTATNTGITAAIDRDGRVIARLQQFTEGRLEISAQGYSGATPYVRLRDWPVVLACLLIFTLLTVRAKRSR